MSDLTSFIYQPLKEDDESKQGWEKSTIDYIVKNPTEVKKAIKETARSINRQLQKAEVEDIYAEVIEYGYNAGDYDIDKAYEKSRSDTIVSFTSYVTTMVRCCVRRYVSERRKDESHKVRTVIEGEDKDVVLFDILPDERSNEKYSDVMTDLDDICKSHLADRYVFGADMFLIWYVKLLGQLHNKDDRTEMVLNVLGVPSKVIKDCRKKSSNSDVMLEIAKAITLYGIEAAINIIRKYVYAADRIEQMVDAL